MTEPYTAIGLALGSGGARGLAHIGVLKVLEGEGIPIACIAGTSIGAFIGALYAAGVPTRQMEQALCDLDWRALTRLVVPTLPTSGLLDGGKVARFMAELLPVQTFEELTIPLAVTATDVESGEALVIHRGSLLEGLHAATAFPGIFPPVPRDGRFLVDGGLCNPVPADVAYSMGARLVIGVSAIPELPKPPPTLLRESPGQPLKMHRPLRDFFTGAQLETLLREIWQRGGNRQSTEPEQQPPHRPKRRPPGIFKVCARSVAIMENQINDLRLEKEAIDLLIRPCLDEISLLDFHRAEEAIAAGEAATRQRLPEILKLLK
ncbi:MAG: patatin-like phospholipase family protein [Syntrophotaleaceae bacterium]